MSLKEHLSFVTKGTFSVSDYLHSVQLIINELVLINHLVDDIDLVIVTFNGLKPSFCEFTTSIHIKNIFLLFDELLEKLVDFEIFMQCDEH
uniref:Retrovirus-related Pol polyprotein from transposon TNT 1-94 n=1 Tax=Cajanus cajan TaxID=3821 RepID=A0A151RTI9_CAJCA|nr:hypothetical protein KK1_032599 [Cajanus cajan]